MGKKLFVGNLPFSANDQVLMDLFSNYGTVESAKIIMDRDSGRSKGFAFVEMSSESEAEAAIAKLNGADCDGRAMVVNEAKPMEPRDRRGPPSGGRGNGRGYAGGGQRRY